MSDFGSVRPDESPAVTNLGRLLARLTLDEVLFEKFDKNPSQVIGDAGLSDEERKAIESGSWSAIKKCICPGPKPVPVEEPPGG